MLASTDYTGIATLVAALCTGIAAIIAAVYAGRANHKVSTPEGTPNIGALATNTAAAVTTPPGRATIGQAVSDGVETLEHVHDIVCGDPPATAPKP